MWRKILILSFLLLWFGEATFSQNSSFDISIKVCSDFRIRPFYIGGPYNIVQNLDAPYVEYSVNKQINGVPLGVEFGVNHERWKATLGLKYLTKYDHLFNTIERVDTNLYPVAWYEEQFTWQHDLIFFVRKEFQIRKFTLLAEAGFGKLGMGSKVEFGRLVQLGSDLLQYKNTIDYSYQSIFLGLMMKRDKIDIGVKLYYSRGKMHNFTRYDYVLYPAFSLNYELPFEKELDTD